MVSTISNKCNEMRSLVMKSWISNQKN